VRTVVEKNLVEASRGAAGIVVAGSRMTVRNNIVARNAGGGIVVDAAAPPRDIWIVHNTLIENAVAGVDVGDWAGAADNVLAYNAILPAAGAGAVRPVSPAGTVRINVTCGAADACFAANLAPTPGGPLIDAAGQGPESWRPVDDFTDALRHGAADVGALELLP
jgi:hypothetical protein